MSKVLTPTEALLSSQKQQQKQQQHRQKQNKSNAKTTNKKQTTKKCNNKNNCSSNSSRSSSFSSSSTTATLTGGLDIDDFTASSSILEFLRKERECNTDYDADSIFQEVSRLTDSSDTRSVDEILREAELLLQQQQQSMSSGINGQHKKTKRLSALLKQKLKSQKLNNKEHAKCTKNIENMQPNSVICNGEEIVALKSSPTMQKICSNDATPTPQTPHSSGKQFTAFVDNLPTESVLSEESTPKDLNNFTLNTEKDAYNNNNNNNTNNNQQQNMQYADDTDEGTDTMEEITEGIETLELMPNETADKLNESSDNKDDDATYKISKPSQHITTMITSYTLSNTMTSSTSTSRLQQQQQQQQQMHTVVNRRASGELNILPHNFMPSPTRRAPLNFNATQKCSPSPATMEHTRRNSIGLMRGSSNTTPDSGVGYSQASPHTARPYSPQNKLTVSMSSLNSTLDKNCLDSSRNCSPKRMVNAVTSPMEDICALTREHALKNEIEALQEKLKDTEERLQSMRIQHESLSQLHRDLRESSSHLQEQSELLKLDVQHLNECANILRSELQAARSDRNEALDLQKQLQAELEESRQERKRVHEQKEKSDKTIIDLQRQCREMERILVRKHPDSVSALIVASKNIGKSPNNAEQDSNSSRKLLEQRIAQLEADAKEQDAKAQQILANVQARFNAVQAKYETHIADLETQVLSLQEINTKLNEKIESQVRTLDYFMSKKAENYYSNCTQTEESALQPVSVQETKRGKSVVSTQTAGKAATRDHSTNTIGALNSSPTQKQLSANSSASSTANSTPNNSRPSSKQSGVRKPLLNGLTSSLQNSKLPVSQSDSTISLSAYHATAKEDAHLLATIRGMRVDLAIKDKAMQRLSRELDDCKKTIKKLQKEKEVLKTDRAGSATHGLDKASEQALREAQNKIKTLEADYKTLHDKRLQDLKTLQTAHERELATCHETVQLLQHRLNEHDNTLVTQKRRKLPVDYYALKAKVSSLERRHSEREERLHMLVEALSKGRLNGALEDLLAGEKTSHKNQQ